MLTGSNFPFVDREKCCIWTSFSMSSRKLGPQATITIEASRVKVHHWPYSFEDGQTVYPAKAIDSRLQGEYIQLVQVRQNLIKVSSGCQPRNRLSLSLLLSFSSSSYIFLSQSKNKTQPDLSYPTTMNPAKGRNSTSILHVPPLVRTSSKCVHACQVTLFFVCETWKIFRSLHFEQNQKTKVEIKRMAWPRFDPPNLHRKSLIFQLDHKELDDFGRSKSAEGRRRRTTARHSGLLKRTFLP